MCFFRSIRYKFQFLIEVLIIFSQGVSQFPPKRCICGTNQYRVQLRIIGGANTHAHEFPWHVGIYRAGDANPRCGGTLITNQHVVTAAHCFPTMTPSRTNVLVGGHDLTKVQGFIFFVEEWYSHPDHHNYSVNDIGIIKLQTTVFFGDTIKPVCFPVPGFDYTRTFATVIGWGYTTKKGARPSIMKKVQLSILAIRECRKAYGQYVVHSSTICAGVVQEGHGPCHADSGGGLFSYHARNQQWFFIGITSFGPRECAIADAPVVFTRVDYYYDWISKMISNAASCPSH